MYQKAHISTLNTMNDVLATMCDLKLFTLLVPHYPIFTYGIPQIPYLLAAYTVNLQKLQKGVSLRTGELQKGMPSSRLQTDSGPELGPMTVNVKIAQSCPTLCDPVDCSPPGSSVHGIF